MERAPLHVPAYPNIRISDSYNALLYSESGATLLRQTMTERERERERERQRDRQTICHSAKTTWPVRLSVSLSHSHTLLKPWF